MIVVFLGGARSGKSRLAEHRATRTDPVTYVATAIVDADDADFAARIAGHRSRRPADWATVEATGIELAGQLRRIEGTAIIDSLGGWVANHHDFAVDVDALLDAITRRTGDTIVVSEEVGLGVHPATDVGRRFRDALGALNQAVAGIADEVVLVVAGRVLPLERAE